MAAVDGNRHRCRPAVSQWDCHHLGPRGHDLGDLHVLQFHHPLDHLASLLVEVPLTMGLFHGETNLVLRFIRVACPAARKEPAQQVKARTSHDHQGSGQPDQRPPEPPGRHHHPAASQTSSGIGDDHQHDPTEQRPAGGSPNLGACSGLPADHQRGQHRRDDNDAGRDKGDGATGGHDFVIGLGAAPATAEFLEVVPLGPANGPGLNGSKRRQPEKDKCCLHQCLSL